MILKTKTILDRGRMGVGLFGVTAVLATGGIWLAPSTLAANYSASISTSGAQSINVAPGASGGAGTSIGADDINVTTTCRSGYNLSLSTSVDNNNLYLEGDSDNVYFAPASGESTLAESPNTWGYLMPDGGGSGTPGATSVFSAIPTVNNPVRIKSALTTPSDTDIDDSFTVYYGVAVSSDMAPGTYKMIPDSNNGNADGTIIYRLTMADECVAYTVNFSPTSMFEGSQLSGTGTVPNQTMHEGVPVNLTTNTFTVPSVAGKTFYFAGWNTAPDGTGTQYSGGEEVTDLAAVGDTITLYAMWTDCPANKICYDKTISEAMGSMSNQSVTSNTTVTLNAPDFSSGDPNNSALPGNYGFLGWSPIKISPNDDNFRDELADLVAGNLIYGPCGSIELGSTETGGKKLYAIWAPVEKDANDDELTFQTANLLNIQLADTTDGATLGDKPVGYATALRDYRDNQVYAVAKLADGKYWMIENLRLESPYTVGQNQNDSSITNESLAQGYHKYPGTGTNYGDFVGLADVEAQTFLSDTPNSLYSSDGSDGTMSINSVDFWSYRMPRYNNVNTLDTVPGAITTLSTTYAHGNYYTWSAAAADTSYYSTINRSSTTSSICPAGWRLPRGGDKSIISTNDFWNLIVAAVGFTPANTSSTNQPYYNYSADEGKTASRTFRAFPNNFVLGGIHDRTNHRNQGSNGVYWTSTTYAHMAYGVDFTVNGVQPATNFGAIDYGESVRCIQGSV